MFNIYRGLDHARGEPIRYDFRNPNGSFIHQQPSDFGGILFLPDGSISSTGFPRI